jgi:radical SAM protein with 4Fe4S-binding SPASM domain
MNVRVAAFEIIETCNLHCAFCVRNASSRLRGVLDFDRFRARVRSVAGSSPLELVALTGGEPFLHPQLTSLARVAARFAPGVSITTNGTRTDPAQLDDLAHLRAVHLIVSIDGPAPIHDRIRGLRGAFTQAVRFVEHCRRRGLAVLVNMTVNEVNHRFVHRTARIARDLGARDISIALVKPEGRGRTSPGDACVLTETARQFLHARQELAGRDFVVRFSEPLAHVFDPALIRPGVTRGCGATSDSIHVQHDGTVRYCTACDAAMGNLDDPQFPLAWHRWTEDPLRGNGARRAFGGACGGCEFADACGGCRCRAAAEGADARGPDPLCPRNQLRCVDAVAALPVCSALRVAIEIGAVDQQLSGRRVLVADAGSMKFATALADLAVDVDVVERSLRLQEALARLARVRSSPRWIGRSLLDLRLLTDRRYDVVCLHDPLGSNRHPRYAVHLAIRHLRPGGAVVLAQPASDADARRDLLDLVCEAGLERSRVIAFDHDSLCLVARRPL